MGRRGARAGSDLRRADDGERKRVRVVEAQYFDGLVAREGDFNPFSDRGWRKLAAACRELLGGAVSGRVLDVGCGTGQSQRVYREEEDPGYTGIDLSIAAVVRACRGYPGLDWLAADATALPYRSETFDLVSFSSVLHHLPAPVEALREGARLVKPGGWVFAFDPNLMHPPMALFRHPRSPLYSPTGVSPNERPVLAAEVRSWFEQAGLAGIRQRCRSGISFRRVPVRALGLLLPLYNVADRGLEALGLGRWLGSFVLTAARKDGRSP